VCGLAEVNAGRKLQECTGGQAALQVRQHFHCVLRRALLSRPHPLPHRLADSLGGGSCRLGVINAVACGKRLPG
jgi:hypothetical protein